MSHPILLKLLTHTYMQIKQRRESLHYQRMIIIHSRDMWMSNIIASQMMVKQMINNISVVMYRQHTSSLRATSSLLTRHSTGSQHT